MAHCNGDANALVIQHATDCPECNGPVRVTIQARSNLYICRQGGSHGRQLLPALSAALEVSQSRLLDPRWARAYWNDRPARKRLPSRPLPSPAAAQGWASALQSQDAAHAYDWLVDVRGISPDVIRAAMVGYDRDRGVLTFPMFSGGKLVAFKTREPRAGAQMRSWPGRDRPWSLYPEPHPEWDEVITTAGELDGLSGLSNGLPVCSVTLGAGTWRDDWTAALHGQRVYVCFDNNEQRQARDRVRQLREAGIRARRLDLRDLGLSTPKGDLSDYLNAGGDPDRLLAFARRRRVKVGGR